MQGYSSGMRAYGTNHYAQEGIFKRWSGLNKGGQYHGFVWLFDFMERKFERVHSQNVFSRKGLFDAETERRFNHLVEQPLAQFRNDEVRRRRRAGGQVSGRAVDGRSFRALSLLWAMQTARFADAYAFDNGTNDSQMAKALLQRPPKQLDLIAEYFRNRFDFATVTLRYLPLYYPEFGSYVFPILDPERKRAPSFAMVYPLDVHFAFVAMPKGSNGVTSDERQLVLYSVGSGQSRSVIVPAVLMERPEMQSEVAAYLMDARAFVEKVFCIVRDTLGSGADGSGLPKGYPWPI
jgi:hypothetical protein